MTAPDLHMVEQGFSSVLFLVGVLGMFLRKKKNVRDLHILPVGTYIITVMSTVYICIFMLYVI